MNNKGEKVEGIEEYVGYIFGIEREIYKYKDTPFEKGIEELANLKAKLRYVKRDGNCFYFSVIFLVLEHYLASQTQSNELLNKLTEINKSLMESGVEEYLVEEFIGPIVSILKAASIGNITKLEELDRVFWDYTVVYFRMITSIHIKTNRDKFEMFIDGDLNEYCQKNIEAMNQYAGEIEMESISTALAISFDVICIENGQKVVYTKGQGDKIGSLLFMSEHFNIVYCT
ncbi:ubiquitin thioesterase protein OTUB1 [Nematocida sp. AWRm80]|nr:ubiquitin thioesterase protein OTUB1 [Nematocida sp. AWRm80]